MEGEAEEVVAGPSPTVDRFHLTDAPHSKVKRKMLKKNLQMYCGLHINKSSAEKLLGMEEENDQEICHLTHYFDPFGGAGKFTPDDVDVSDWEKTDVCDFGTPIIAIDVCTVMVKNRLEKCTFANGRFLSATRGTSANVSNPTKGGTPQEEEEPDCDESVDAEASEAKRFKSATEESGTPSLSEKSTPRLGCGLFFLGDADAGHLASLKQMVGRWLESRDWICSSRSGDAANRKEIFIFERRTDSIIFFIEVQFHRKEFLQWESHISQLGRPLFSFVDPYGVRDLKMSFIAKLIGSDRSVMLFLNVEALNRIHSCHEHLIDQVYGEKAVWKNAFEMANALVETIKDKVAVTNFKLHCLVQKYVEMINLFGSGAGDGPIPGFDVVAHPSGNGQRMLVPRLKKVRVASFALRRGSSRRPDSRTLAYLIYGCGSLSALQNAKFAMQALCSPKSKDKFVSKELSDKADGVYYSDYYSVNGYPAVGYRNYSHREQATVIFDHFAGAGAVTLGEVRRFILEETGFPYLATPLKIMEQDGRIASVDTRGDMRKGYNFYTNKIPFDEKANRAGNRWILHFVSREEGERIAKELIGKKIQKNNQIPRKPRKQKQKQQ